MGSAYTPLSSAAGNKYPFPSYSDLGKECRDLFSKGYNLGLFKVNVKNRTCHGIEITTSGVHTHEDKTARGEVNLKASYPAIVPGLASAHKWDTDNVLKNEISLQDTLYPGLKLTTEFALDGEKNNMGGAIKVQQKHPFFTFDGTVNGADDKNLMVGGALVTGYKGLMIGYSGEIDANSVEMKRNALGFAYHNKDYTFFLSRDNNSGAFEGCFHHKINRELEIAVQGNTKGGGGGGGGGASAPAAEGEEGGTSGGGGGGGSGSDGGPQFSIAGKYMFNGYGHILRAKVNNKSMLGLGLELKIMPGWQVFAGTEVDLKKFADGNHKIGFGMDFGFD